jgi:hypothetical protein
MAGYCCYCLYGDSLLLLLLSGLSPPVRRPLHDCQGTRHDRQPTHPHAFLVCHYANRKRTSLSFRLIQFNFPCVFCATRADLPAPPCSYLLQPLSRGNRHCSVAAKISCTMPCSSSICFALPLTRFACLICIPSFPFHSFGSSDRRTSHHTASIYKILDRVSSRCSSSVGITRVEIGQRDLA